MAGFNVSECSFSFFNESGKCLFVVNSKLCEHFSVEVDTCFFKSVHESAVVHAVNLSLSRNSGDPELTEISLLELSANESVVTALHYGLLSHLEVLALGAPIALSSF